MRPALLDLLACPLSAQPLQLEVLAGDDADVTYGLLSSDAATYPIVAGIPVLRGGDEDAVALLRAGRHDSQYRKLGLPKEDELSGRGVSYCATCDGFFFRDQDIAVVGGGDTAMEEATFLTRFAKTVTVIHRRDTLRASKAMQERAFADPKIKFIWDTEVAEIKDTDGKLSGLTLRNTRTGETSGLPVTGLFIAIGHEPRVELFADQLELDPQGYLKVESPSTRTNIPGVFAAGDVVDHTYRQAITAAGSGCAAALDAERYLAALTDAESLQV